MLLTSIKNGLILLVTTGTIAGIDEALAPKLRVENGGNNRELPVKVDKGSY